ncbi:hypothetical protein [Roseivivax sediminis]|uniref:O-antigen ligase like membrane protein n=1 Tax=Roseivivax sediminis TaxID=936889 RepID=A0A1I1UF76_9RHOB|nr:hypothetical protein [Roseivivax sediminis]SFD68258.1 hypothetical protein SAMN04515678_102266 [Roseivivax sediminis]
MPNMLAYLMLALWPVLTLVMFQRLPPSRAMLIAIVGGYLVLPEPPAVFDLPLFPPFTKHNIPALSAFLALLWTQGRSAPLFPRNLMARALLAIFVISPVFTVLVNPEPLVFDAAVIPGLGFKDMIALPMTQALLILPFLLARRLLATGEAQRETLRALFWGGMAYSVLMLIEIRLSPQINLWVYGYYQHAFDQTIRFGGFRPMVFLYHGLWVAFFCMMAMVAAWALWKSDTRGNRLVYFLSALYLTAILVLAKSLGALILAVGLVPLVLLLNPVMQINAAILIACLSMAYPVMKGAGIVPEETLLARAEAIDADRARSIEFRFDQEEVLLEKAREKPVFGWGSWGRNHIHDEVTGRILTVADGRWIITIGIYGWIGFLAEFGLISLPIFLLWRETVSRRDGEVARYIAPLTLLLAFNLFDMLPNATLTPITWLIAGALTGYAEVLRAERLRERPAARMKWKPIL